MHLSGGRFHAVSLLAVSARFARQHTCLRKRGRIPSVRFPCGMGRIPGLRTRRARPFLRRNSYPKGTFRSRLRIRSEILRPPVEGCGYFKGNTGGEVCGRPPCRPRRLHPFRYVDPEQARSRGDDFGYRLRQPQTHGLHGRIALAQDRNVMVVAVVLLGELVQSSSR